MVVETVQTISPTALGLVSMTSAGIVGVFLMLLTKSLTATHHWENTIGTVSRIEIFENTEDQSYCVTVSYSYIADGQTYNGSAVQYDVDGALNNFTINRLQEMYPHGAPITVYYNSARPHDSRLDATTDDGLFLAYILVPAACAGVFALSQWVTPVIFKLLGAH